MGACGQFEESAALHQHEFFALREFIGLRPYRIGTARTNGDDLAGFS
jgi:hypothetical protein